MGLGQCVIARGPDGKTEQIGYWRKHPDLHGWMEDLWLGIPGADEAYLELATQRVLEEREKRAKSARLADLRGGHGLRSCPACRGTCACVPRGHSVVEHEGSAHIPHRKGK